MSATETELTPEQIREYASKPLVIACLGDSRVSTRQTINGEANNFRGGYCDRGVEIYGGGEGSDDNRYLHLTAEFPVSIDKYDNDGNRRIGYISGVNSDGSFHIHMLGTGTITFSPTGYVRTKCVSDMFIDTVFNPTTLERDMPSDIFPFTFYSTDSHPDNKRNAYASTNATDTTYVSDLDSFMYQPTWITGDIDYPCSVIADCSKHNGNFLFGNIARDNYHAIQNFQLTNNESNLEIGVPANGLYWQRSQSGIYWGDKNIGGDLHDLMDTFTTHLNNSWRDVPIHILWHRMELPDNMGYVKIYNAYPPFNGTMAYHYTPYNLILTYDLQQAKRYVETGELPSDAFIYPFDVDSIPINTTGDPSPDGSDGTQPDDTPDTGGNSGGEDTDNAPPRKPTNSAQALTNNNLYWLTSTQLKNFIDWFWTDATDVTDPQELFEKIQGLYSNLSQAIVNIRYMPVDPSWIGGTSLDTKIIVGLVEKEEQVQTINKTVADIITIGEITVEELADFKGFINYSPYCQMSLYLPFYGFIDLDCDLLMPNDKKKNTNKLKVYATYDILSGTIQYFIYRVSSSGNENMINCVSAKMAVDIPISLQTKTERDSMIFNNVSSATANLIGAGASVATGNPIGLVMSTAAIAGQQSAGAPMRVMGTIGESGAFYDDGHCALYIKRPATNYPEQYGKRIGYPYNAKGLLEKVHGFVQCQNPYISFSHVTTEDSDGFPPPKPTAEEIDTIYAALQEGVYLP